MLPNLPHFQLYSAAALSTHYLDGLSDLHSEGHMLPEISIDETQHTNNLVRAATIHRRGTAYAQQHIDKLPETGIRTQTRR